MLRNYIEETEMLDQMKIAISYNSLSIGIDFAGVWFFPAGSEYDFHMHPNYEIHYIKEGKGRVILNNVEYMLSKGSFYVTGPGILHKQFADGGVTMVEYGMKFDLSIGQTDEGTIKYPSEEYNEVIKLLSSREAYVTVDQNNIEQLFEGMFEEVRNKRVGYYSQINNLIIRIIVASARNYDNSVASYEIPQKDMDSIRMNIVNSYISDHIGKNINRMELASVLGLSVRQLERIIRNCTAMSTHDFILNKKMDIVKQMLNSSSMTLSHISSITGFSSEFHLSRVFKKIIGVSPREYRKSIVPIDK